MEEKQIYCLRCKKKVGVSSFELKKTKRGQNMIVGVCPICGAPVHQFTKQT